MPRYSTHPPKSWVADDDDWYEPPLLTSIDVCDREAVNTGLLDKDGNSIWRSPDPMGFIHFD